MDKTKTSGHSRMRAYLQLFRIPNVFTAIADVTMGFLFVRRSLEPYEAWIAILAASALLYTAGMVLNDVYDMEIDAQERPERPLPSGRISRASAAVTGYAFLAAGMLAAVLSWIPGGATPVAGLRSGLVGCTLAMTVWLYDAVLKSTPLGPFVMGGMSHVERAHGDEPRTCRRRAGEPDSF